MTWPAVRAIWVDLNDDLEGIVLTMYVDSIGLITTAMGNLIDPIESALAVPFMRADGSAATRQEIAAEWRLLKSKKSELAKGGWVPASKLCKLKLTPAGVTQVVSAKFDEMARDLRKRFPDFKEWPADAQLATLSLSWAAGQHFNFPKLEAALRERDFKTAVKECHLNEYGPDRKKGGGDDNEGLIPRNIANKIMFANAALVQAYKLDPSELIYPEKLVAPPPDVEIPVDVMPAQEDDPILHPIPDLSELARRREG